MFHFAKMSGIAVLLFGLMGTVVGQQGARSVEVENVITNPNAWSGGDITPLCVTMGNMAMLLGNVIMNKQSWSDLSTVNYNALFVNLIKYRNKNDFVIGWTTQNAASALYQADNEGSPIRILLSGVFIQYKKNDDIGSEVRNDLKKTVDLIGITFVSNANQSTAGADGFLSFIRKVYTQQLDKPSLEAASDENLQVALEFLQKAGVLELTPRASGIVLANKNGINDEFASRVAKKDVATKAYVDALRAKIALNVVSARDAELLEVLTSLSSLDVKNYLSEAEQNTASQTTAAIKIEQGARQAFRTSVTSRLALDVKVAANEDLASLLALLNDAATKNYLQDAEKAALATKAKMIADELALRVALRKQLSTNLSVNIKEKSDEELATFVNFVDSNVVYKK